MSGIPEGSSRQPRIRLGMVGGGAGAFIGDVHRMAARLDDQFELVAGALSSTPDKARVSGAALGLDPARTYADYRVMAEAEASRADGIEAVSIVTPNHLHFPVAREFLARGIHVICDKPLTSRLADAKELFRLAQTSSALFVLTHNYTGYAMVRQARALVQSGALGEIRLVQVEYPQDWLADPVEKDGQKQAAWRTDPARSGIGGSTCDIGSHAYHLAGFVTGLEVEELAADAHVFVEGRQLDDNAHVLLRYQGGAKGMLWCSQVASGCDNGLKLRVFGTKGGLEWQQTDPDHLRFSQRGKPIQLFTRAGSGLDEASRRVSRLPAGHPEGYLEAFATIYSEAAKAILAQRTGTALDPAVTFPSIDDGLRGVAFIEACVLSSRSNAAWIRPKDL